MKQIVVAIAVLLLAGCADVTPISDADKGKPIEYVQKVPDKSINEIYSSTKAWIAETFILGKAVLVSDDRYAGRIAIDGRIPYPCEKGCDDVILFNLKMAMQDGEVKLTFTDVRIAGPEANHGQPGETAIYLEHDLKAAKAQFKQLSDSLRASIMGENTGAGFQ